MYIDTVSLTKRDSPLISEIVNNVVDEKLDAKLQTLRNDFYNKVDPFSAQIETAGAERVVISE